jgi:two-component system sensor histidine kinase/response regulator
VGGNTGLLRKMLLMFRESQADVISAIRLACEAGERKTAERLAHTLKGLSGNIGATELFEASRQLEFGLKPEQAAMPQALMAKVENLLASLISEIDRVHPPDVAKATSALSAPLDVATLTPLLQGLARLLGDDDGEATTRIEPLAALLKDSPLADDCRSLDKLIGNFAFAEALKLLRRIAEKLNIQLD